MVNGIIVRSTGRSVEDVVYSCCVRVDDLTRRDNSFLFGVEWYCECDAMAIRLVAPLVEV